MMRFRAQDLEGCNQETPGADRYLDDNLFHPHDLLLHDIVPVAMTAARI